MLIQRTWLIQFHVKRVLRARKLSRKRRRQLYFAKKTLRSVQNKRSRRQKDNLQFDEPPPVPRRQIFIEDKFKVVQFYEDLQDQKQKARDFLKKPKDPDMGARKWKEEREKAREVLRHSVQSECEKKFGPVVGKNQVCKWVKAAKKERWDLLPQAVRVRSVTTPNQWRSKHALAPRGRRVGGHVPMELQRELDRLILATVRGNSDVTERTDVVTTDHIAPRSHTERYSKPCGCFLGSWQ